MQECDTLLMVGTSFPYAEFLPEGEPAKPAAPASTAQPKGE